MRSARIRREQERANLAENTKYQAGEKEAEESSEADANVSVGSSTSEEVEECELERKKLPESFASLEVKDKNFPAVRETPHKKDLSKDVVLPELKILNMPQTPKFRKDKLADSATSMTMESPMSLYAHNQDFSSPTIPKTNACLSPREKNDNDNGRPLFMSWVSTIYVAERCISFLLTLLSHTIIAGSGTRSTGRARKTSQVASTTDPGNAVREFSSSLDRSP